MAILTQTSDQLRPGAPRTLLGRSFQFLRRWPVLPGIVIAILVFAAIFAPLLTPYDPAEGNIRERLAPPMWYAEGSSSHVLGTDQQGRDVLTRIIYGARISLIVGGAALWIGIVLGTVMGLAAGYYGGWVDEITMRLVEIWLGVPFILIVLILVVVIGQSLMLLVGILGISTWAGYTRQVRGISLQVKAMDYVALAHVAGASPARIMFYHIFPSTVPIIIVLSSLQVGGLILAEGSLSFLGIGVPPPTPSWGAIMASGRTYLVSAWWVAMFAGLAMFVVIMAFNFLGDWLRDRLDPTIRQTRD